MTKEHHTKEERKQNKISQIAQKPFQFSAFARWVCGSSTLIFSLTEFCNYICWAHTDLQQAGHLPQQGCWSLALPRPRVPLSCSSQTAVGVGWGWTPLGWSMELTQAVFWQVALHHPTPNIFFLPSLFSSQPSNSQHSALPFLPLLGIFLKNLCNMGNRFSGQF